MSNLKKYLEIGKIVNTHGIRGDVKIQVWADSPNFLTEFNRVFVDGAEVKILSSRVHKNCVIATLNGVSDVNAAMSMKGKVVYIDRSDAKLPKGDFFIQDILGAEVSDVDGNVLGELVDILNMPASDIYVVKGEREIMIPAVPEFIVKTDLENKKIVVKMIEGL